MAWPIVTFNDAEYYKGEGVTLIPVDPTTGVAIFMIKRDGGIASGVVGIEQGDPGVHAEIDSTINFTALDPDDPTEDSASWTELTPGSGSTPQVSRLNLALHKGEPGDDGSTSIDLDTIDGTAAAGKIIKANSDADGFDWAFEKVGGRFIPASADSVANSGSGDDNSTLTTIGIPAQNTDCRVMPVGYTIVTYNGGTDVRVDLVARLNGETGGNIVGRCQGIGGTERLMLAPISPAGSADTFDKVSAGNAATVYIRTEKQGGANGYTTSKSTTLLGVWVIPV